MKYPLGESVSVLPFVLAGLVMTGAAIAPSSAGAEIFSTDQFKVTADFRARLESDWASQRSNGVKRDDRTRARIRTRLGVNYNATDHFSLGIRMRTGSDDSHQSPHITVLDFNNNDTGDADVNLDKWFLKAKVNGFSSWIGRNSLPYWKQNEFFWSDDVTPAGIGASYSTKFDSAKLTVNGGYFSLPVGMQDFAGNLGVGQIVFATDLQGAAVTAAGGVLIFDANPGDVDATRLLNGNGARDYTIWTGGLQVKFKAGGLGQPITLGFDYMHNSEDYSVTDPDPFTVANRGERDGFAGSIKLGKLKEKGDWLAAYYYAHIETLAVNSSYAQDNWVRWGSATEVRASNLKGHEFRLAYAIRKNLNAVARFYVADAITTIEDGNRFRLDFNYKF
ncbi:MAG: putative porin [Sphingomonadales bacterium]